PVDADDGAVLNALLELPAPPRPLDGGDAGALRTISLVRAWASSRAALKSMLRSRHRVTTAIAQGLEAGRMPTRNETREWRAAHPRQRVIAFSEFASTISAYFERLRSDPGVGMLTARAARIVTGRIARDEMLARFAPDAQGARAYGAHDAVTLLLATDLLSE